MQTQHLSIKHGARITSVIGVGHSTYKGVAEWYFLGTLEWPAAEGKPSSVQLNREIFPYSVCYDDDAGKLECHAIMKALDEYLGNTGKWLRQPKEMSDGRLVYWTAKQKTGLAPL